MKKHFVFKKFSADAAAIVDKAVGIVNRYEALDLKLSLRQLYYQLVATNAVENTEKSYKRVGDIIADARMAGILDWDMIEDRNRSTISQPHWKNPADIIRMCALGYHVDKWEGQPNYLEVMVEKQALEGVLEPVCRRNDVRFTANKGYSSVTMMFYAGQRIQREFFERCRGKDILPEECFPEHDLFKRGGAAKYLVNEGLLDEYGRVTDKGKGILPRMVVLYMGDHDPSGIDMTRDVADRLRTFSDFTPIEVKRLALNMAQIEELNPPENPAKMTDSRAAEYVRQFGHSSWELDAVEPTAMAAMVEEGILEVRDDDVWDTNVRCEEADKALLETLAKQCESQADMTKGTPEKKPRRKK